MKVDVEVAGKAVTVEADLEGTPGRGLRARIDGREVAAEAVWTSSRELELTIDGRAFDVVLGEANADFVDVTVRGRRLRVGLGSAAGPSSGRGRTRKGGGLVVAPMPGKVVALLVEPGAHVVEGQGLVVVEAMKMENELQAPAAGIVRQVFVKPGQIVEGDAPLLEIGAAS
jgi:biotin carboxyl carrier protein